MGCIYVPDAIISSDGFKTDGSRQCMDWDDKWKEKLSDTPAHVIEDWTHGS